MWINVCVLLNDFLPTYLVHERRIRANNREYNAQFKYAVSDYIYVYDYYSLQSSRCRFWLITDSETNLIDNYLFFSICIRQNNYIKTSKYTLL